jgi:hypothetical protein
MTASENILELLKVEIESLSSQRQEVLNQLTLVNLQIKNYDRLIINIDREVLGYINEINNSINEVKKAYDDLITSGCRNDLAWVEINRWNEKIQSGAGPGSTVYDVETIQYEVKKDPNLRRTIPYHGIKYYRQPSNRDYGTVIIDNFNGAIGLGETTLKILDESLPSGVEIGNSITDSIDSPVIFSPSNFPSIVGLGTTTSVGLVTSIVGRIGIGTTVFLHTGSGSLIGLSTGMILSRETVLEENTKIVGIGSTTVITSFFTPSGVSTTGFITLNTLILDKLSIGVASEASFNVGIITTLNSIFLSTSSLNKTDYSNFIIFKAEDIDDIDENFDPLGNPNAPLEIGIITNPKLGYGHSSFYDTSGETNDTQIYNQNETYFDPVINRVVNPEPDVGAGRVEYYEGNQQWPIKITPVVSNNTIVSYAQTAANLGDVVIVRTGSGIGTGTSIGYASTGPNSALCTSGILNGFLDEIDTANSNYNSTVSRNQPKALGLSAGSKTLRRQRGPKELYAWSLLQGASYLRQKLNELEGELNQLERFDLKIFN